VNYISSDRDTLGRVQQLNPMGLPRVMIVEAMAISSGLEQDARQSATLQRHDPFDHCTEARYTSGYLKDDPSLSASRDCDDKRAPGSNIDNAAVYSLEILEEN
jgi:hypothetical protein